MGLFDFSKKEEKHQEPTVKDLPLFPRRILVYIDGSEGSFRALDLALAIAARIPGCELSGTFVIDQASLDSLLQLHYVVEEERNGLIEELQEKAERTLENARQRASDVGVTLNTYILKGRVHQAIQHAIRQLSTELLLIGGWDNSYSHKDTTSVECQLVLDQAKCHVLVVR